MLLLKLTSSNINSIDLIEELPELWSPMPYDNEDIDEKKIFQTKRDLGCYFGSFDIPYDSKQIIKVTEMMTKPFSRMKHPVVTYSAIKV